MDAEERWTDPVWLAGAHAWIDARLADLGRPRTGEIEQPHVRTWGTVMRVPTADGTVWFKAPEDALRHEAAVHAVVAARRPDRVPPLLAVDASQGWMLSADAGRRLREVVEEERSLARWHDVLGACAEIQLACEPDVPALLAAGVPHRPLATLAADYAAFVARVEVEPRFRDAAGTVAEMATRLASYGITETVQHDDLHDGQVFVPPARSSAAPHLILDWGDACVTHPFFTLSVTLLGVVSFGVDDVTGSEDTAPFRDSYLAPYAAAQGATVADLREPADLAAR
ncbi:phosphotransferase, partial [Nocardioides sp.]|uniref:phosphotransferase n=1 Tax=Nocardioides sp. TaxID=35761 RepID=UPI002726F894